jgi:hypothetical protein
MAKIKKTDDLLIIRMLTPFVLLGTDVPSVGYDFSPVITLSIIPPVSCCVPGVSGIKKPGPISCDFSATRLSA